LTGTRGRDLRRAHGFHSDLLHHSHAFVNADLHLPHLLVKRGAEQLDSQTVVVQPDLNSLNIKLRAQYVLQNLHAFKEDPQFRVHGGRQGQVYESVNLSVRSFDNSHTASKLARGGLGLKGLQT